MLVIVLKAVLVLLLLWVLLWVFSRFFHQALYTQVPEGLLWRSAAGAGTIWAWGVLLPLVGYGLFGWNWPISFDDYFVGRTATTSDEIEFQAFLISRDGREARYELRKETRGLRQERQYLLNGVERLDPSILLPAERAGNAFTFKGVYTVTNQEEQREEKQVTFTPRRELAGLRFDSELGVMAVDEFGVLRTATSSGFVLRMFVFLLLCAVWFAVFAFLLEFYRTHAILSALVAGFVWVFLLNLVTLRAG